MAKIVKNFGSGGAGFSPMPGAGPTLATILRDMADDFALLRNAQNAMATKLNADAGVTDTNYAQVGALKTTKG